MIFHIERAVVEFTTMIWPSSWLYPFPRW
jgi:hypothetical protein